MILSDAAARLNGVAGEAPPNIAASIRTLASIYQADAAALGNLGSIAAVESRMKNIANDPGFQSSLRQLVVYMMTKCG